MDDKRQKPPESKKFSRRIEDFTCGHCGSRVKGNGYTNHCPICLWSKHVDINPGDRASGCLSLMEPIALEIKKGKYIITHRCLLCSHIKKNKSSGDDCFEAITQLSCK